MPNEPDTPSAAAQLDCLGDFTPGATVYRYRDGSGGVVASNWRGGPAIPCAGFVEPRAKGAALIYVNDGTVRGWAGVDHLSNLRSVTDVPDQTITLTAPVPAGGTITVPAELDNGQVLRATVHVPPAPPPVLITSSIAAHATLTGKYTWRATVTGETPTEVDFQVDALPVWVERVAPYQYNGDPSGLLDTTLLANGDHTLTITSLPSGTTLVEVVTVSNGVTPPPPSAPVAAFTTALAGLVVGCADASTNAPTSWAWAFGDGGTSTAQSPTHTYAAAGTYTISLTATNAGGSSSPVTHSVTVSAPIVLPFPGLAAAEAAASPGAIIRIPPGTYLQSARFVSVKTGLVWQATSPGVIFDFSGAVCAQQQAAFEVQGSGAVIQGFRVFGGLASRRVGNVVGYCLSGPNQKAIDMEADHFGEMGASVQQTATGYLILRGKIHDNNLDLPGGGAHSSGNVPPFNPGWEAGGVKIWDTNGIVDGLEGWNNFGPGVWPDTGNHDTIIRNVRYHDSPYTAIMWEVSTGVQILDNVVWECCWGDGYTGGARDFWSCGILVSSAGSAIVRGNLVAWCPSGVIFASQDRPDKVPTTGDDADGNRFAITAGQSHWVHSSRDWSDPAPLPIMSPNAQAVAAQLTAAGVPLAPLAGH